MDHTNLNLYGLTLPEKV